jgi:YD repeat-containing protein
LTTPYGTSRFSASDSGINRTLEMTDPMGGRERIEFRAEEPSMAASEPASTVPTVSGVTFNNQYLQYRNTFYWSRQAMAAGAGDLTKAHVYHWLHVKNNVNQAAAIVESEKAPLQSRVWYRYPNQASAVWEGDGRSPTIVARVLDDGNTQVYTADYNSQGHVTKRVDPLGRETVYEYGTNDIDVVEITQKNGAGDEVLESRTYNSQHRPLTVTDASGQTKTYTYTTSGQVATVTNARNETTTFGYNASKQLTSVTGPVSGATTTLTYDGYGRLHTTTRSDGYVVAVDYDAFDRPVQTTYPDGTTEQTQYRWLDVSRTKDRLGRWTAFTYDAMRRQTSVRDRLGRVIQQEWGASGSLNAPDRRQGPAHHLGAGCAWPRDARDPRGWHHRHALHLRPVGSPENRD